VSSVIAGFNNPLGLAFNPDGTSVLVPNYNANTDAVTVWRDDAACEAAKALETIPPPVRELCRKRASPAVDAGTSP
jgi:DNA-binding beta-propeller fold protein YncE